MRLFMALAVLTILLPAGRLEAQIPTRDSYYNFLPPPPSIVSQTEASERFHLFGDTAAPGYRDIAPKDGVDDRRGERLLQLAEHFSPILRRNTRSVPQELETAVGDRVSIHRDLWRNGVRIASDTIDLGPPSKWGAGTDGYASALMVAPDDSRLESLLRSHHPRRQRPNITPADPPVDTILFMDVPGDNEVNWRPHVRRMAGESRIYVHPFIHEVADARAEHRFEFLLQFWFYYPYNDGANNHEGDWEHLSVSVTTHALARSAHTGAGQRGLLAEHDVAALLDPVVPTPLDSLRIRSVSYYFHNLVMVVPYLRIAGGGTMWKRAGDPNGTIHIWEDTGYMDSAIRRRLALADGRLATHPIGYIGGNNKGLDEILQLIPRGPLSYNRDSHGTYPFPGVWREVGPLGATEKIAGSVVPALRRDARGQPDPSLPWHQLIEDESYLTYRAESIVLLPDWERLEHLVLEDPVVRRQWAWFLLPMHTGFPATRSPGAGALKRVNLGNVAPMGPAYNESWNRPDVSAAFPLYEPSVLRVALAPISPAASLQSGWGIFNVPLVLAGLLPGYNVALTQLMPWVTGAMHLLGSPPAKTFYLGELPMRFTSIGGGGFQPVGGKHFARLLPGPNHPGVQAYLADEGAGSATVAGHRRSAEWGSRAWMHLHYGARLSVENTFAYGTSEVEYTLRDTTQHELTRVSGTLFMRELMGGVTVRLPLTHSDALRVYAGGGYGWSSYSLGRVSLGGEPLDDAEVRGGRLPKVWPSRTWWPNTTYAKLGAEIFSPPRFWLFRRLGYGARVEATGLLHRLAVAGECEDCRVTADRGDLAFTMLFGW